MNGNTPEQKSFKELPGIRAILSEQQECQRGTADAAAGNKDGGRQRRMPVC